MVSQVAIFPPTPKCQRRASRATVSLMITVCTPTRKPAARPTMSATMAARTPSYAALELFSTRESSIATTGIRLSAASQANITAQTLTWAARNRNQDQLKPKLKAPTNEQSKSRQTASTGRPLFSSKIRLRIRRTFNKCRKATKSRQTRTTTFEYDFLMVDNQYYYSPILSFVVVFLVYNPIAKKPKSRFYWINLTKFTTLWDLFSSSSSSSDSSN